MRIILILFVVLFSFANNNFAQSKKKLEQKAQKYIDDILLDGSTRYFLEREFWLQPEEWRWKGYREPICTDSLICTNRQVKRWMKELLNPYDTLTLIERERQFPVIRIDRIDDRIVLCKLHTECKNGFNSFHQWLEFASRKESENVSQDISYMEGYWWVDGKCVVVLGNAVDLFFKRYKDQRMGNPLPPHTTINDMEDSSSGEYVDSRYWVYEGDKLKKYYFTHADDVKEGEYIHPIHIFHSEWYFEEVRKSFK